MTIQGADALGVKMAKSQNGHFFYFEPWVLTGFLLIIIIIYWFKHYIDSQSVDGLPLSRATGSNKNYTNI